jgi:glycosyltransferase involved in cell wall biosynthesis
MTIGGAVSALGALASLVWLGQLARIVAHRRRLIRLADQPADPPEGGWPALAVIVAARDEAGQIEAAIRSLLAQDYPALELIAVDDRSTDGTGAILDAIAAEDPRLRVIHVRELPPGLLGKVHALQAGADAARGADWLLFTDADIVFTPGTLRRAVAFAEGHGADHLTLAPEVVLEGAGERLFVTVFLVAFTFKAPIEQVEHPGRRAHMGVGAFNLVRAESFRAIGGFRRLALSIDDDMRLAEALKAAGSRPRVLLGGGSIAVRWQVGLGGMIRGLEKNFFAGLNFRLAAVFAGVVAMVVVGMTPHLGLFVGPWWARALCAAGVASIAAIVGLTGRQNGIGWYYGLIFPVGVALLSLALLRSTWLTLRRRGVRWRDHLYPLDVLRDHARRRDAWIREVWRSTR